MNTKPRLRDYLATGRHPWGQAWHDRGSLSGACIICGKKVKPSTAIRVILTDGDDTLVRPEDSDNEETVNWQGFMGMWDVGPECGRKIPREYRAEEIRA